jgi:threonyl-tRNA synthetase
MTGAGTFSARGFVPVRRKREKTDTMSELLKISLPDGSVREMPAGSTPADVAAAIGPGLAKAALAARVDGEVRDLNRPFDGDAQLALITARDEAEALELARHDFAHVLAEAVQALWPGTQITFGPATDDGFYYDVLAPASREPFSMDDLPAIEEKMREIIRADKPLTREVWSRQQLIDKWRADGETFKAEWAAELPEGEELTVYRSGQRLARHVPRPAPRQHRQARPAGVQADARRRRLLARRPEERAAHAHLRHRLAQQKQLDEHLHRLEEAAKRDHRRLGQEMDLFHLQQEAHGSVFWHPKGYIVWRELEAYMRRAIDDAGYREVKTPQVMDARQWEQSGHWGKYRENMFVIPDEVPNVEDEGPLVSDAAEWMALKPMNCPAHILIFKQGIKSYRDLPLRLYENGCCHRNEPHGALHGLMRVRQFTQDDAHIFCREDQIHAEVAAFCILADRIYRDSASQTTRSSWRCARTPASAATRCGTRPRPSFASARRRRPSHRQVGCAELPGEGAFYRPKLEWHLTDAIGRTWQVGTIQSDRVLPARLDASLRRRGRRAARAGHAPPRDLRLVRALHRHPHRALRRQAAGVARARCRRWWRRSSRTPTATPAKSPPAPGGGIRVETDVRNEKINYKVREHSVAKVPHLLVVGKREADEGTVALRTLGAEHQKVLRSRGDRAAQGRATPPDLR